ncbi:YdeI/OmpD-associated family protein [Microvirga rosea]|uniref:YdeI/OmpD-associated family protein n=1 Tax=Microvirga rosea TaxID=2715425 RepID=UPI001D0B47B2|nr:YdeI/OmpD-associated family protein [Microvirga rosea]MCB8821857.1 YdeI/OmpD-associated family protein [Microvirga rosea]
MTDLPTDIRDALVQHSDAARAFERLTPSHRRESVRWIDATEKPETRTKRIVGMMERLTAPRGA